MKHSISCTWKEKMAFESVVNGHTIPLDAEEQFGGTDAGPRPKPLILTALAGCTGMDVISLLSKMKQPVSWFNMEVEAELGEDHPKRYTKITLVYQFKSDDGLDVEKVEKAVNMSQEKYCGVASMLRDASDLEFRIDYLD